MVKIMSTAEKPKRVSSHWGNDGVDARSHWFEPDKEVFQEPSLRDEDCSASAPSTCAFWSAIAIGALLANRPTESVSHARVYACMSLRLCFHTCARESSPRFSRCLAAWPHDGCLDIVVLRMPFARRFGGFMWSTWTLQGETFRLRLSYLHCHVLCYAFPAHRASGWKLCTLSKRRPGVLQGVSGRRPNQVRTSQPVTWLDQPPHLPLYGRLLCTA